MQNNAAGVASATAQNAAHQEHHPLLQLSSAMVHNSQGSTRIMLPSSNTRASNHPPQSVHEPGGREVLDLNCSQSHQDPLMLNTSRSKQNHSPSGLRVEDSLGRSIHTLRQHQRLQTRLPSGQPQNITTTSALDSSMAVVEAESSDATPMQRQRHSQADEENCSQLDSTVDQAHSGLPQSRQLHQFDHRRTAEQLQPKSVEATKQANHVAYFTPQDEKEGASPFGFAFEVEHAEQTQFRGASQVSSPFTLCDDQKTQAEYAQAQAQQVQSMRNQKQRLSQPDRLSAAVAHTSQTSHPLASAHPGPNVYDSIGTTGKRSSQNQQSAAGASPKQNTRSFIIRNTTQQTSSVPIQPHQPKILPPVTRAPPQDGTMKVGRSPAINTTLAGSQTTHHSFRLNSRARTNKASPSAAAAPIDSLPRDKGIDGTSRGQIRRLSQNQNSINMYLEQESKFDSTTKDASDLGGHANGSLVRDYYCAPPDSLKTKGKSGGQAQQDRSYDEAWQVDQGSTSNSCYAHGEGSFEQQRLDSAHTSLLNKRRPSANRHPNDCLLEQSVQRSEEQYSTAAAEHSTRLPQADPGPTPVPLKTLKKRQVIQQLSQPRTKDYQRREKDSMRGTLQSQKQARFVGDGAPQNSVLEEEIVLQKVGRGGAGAGQHGKGNNYNSPIQLREPIGLSQQMVPNSMKQQLKQRRTVYGQSFFNSPPYPTHQPFLGGAGGNDQRNSANHHLVGAADTQQQQQYNGGDVQKMGGQDNQTRQTQLDSSLRRKRQLPVPSSSQQAPPQSSHNPKHSSGGGGPPPEINLTRTSVQKPFPLQGQQQSTGPGQTRKTLQRHIESAAQHLEFDERQQNEERRAECTDCRGELESSQPRRGPLSRFASQSLETKSQWKRRWGRPYLKPTRGNLRHAPGRAARARTESPPKEAQTLPQPAALPGAVGAWSERCSGQARYQSGRTGPLEREEATEAVRDGELHSCGRGAHHNQQGQEALARGQLDDADAGKHEPNVLRLQQWLRHSRRDPAQLTPQPDY